MICWTVINWFKNCIISGGYMSKRLLHRPRRDRVKNWPCQEYLNKWWVHNETLKPDSWSAEYQSKTIGGSQFCRSQLADGSCPGTAVKQYYNTQNSVAISFYATSNPQQPLNCWKLLFYLLKCKHFPIHVCLLVQRNYPTNTKQTMMRRRWKVPSPTTRRSTTAANTQRARRRWTLWRRWGDAIISSTGFIFLFPKCVKLMVIPSPFLS